jgi:hypothetical protein
MTLRFRIQPTSKPEVVLLARDEGSGYTLIHGEFTTVEALHDVITRRAKERGLKEVSLSALPEIQGHKLSDAWVQLFEELGDKVSASGYEVR